MEPDFETEDAIERATVIIDCTPKGIGHRNKEKYYSKFSDKVKGFLAQGSESDFGKNMRVVSTMMHYYLKATNSYR